ncbi:hypothetical protein LSUE1_G006689 [Lachnellula suecica]|uniref:Uncharacterized protein n=1 Tax=Lachnellula suecica TaxID=602035 RepID=A0A8T9C3R3_9HELO|nr:hypothetical protein LSUE1_G006689 [Lachnellula suecica]
MGMWPFRKKSNRRPSYGGAALPRSEVDAMHDAGTLRGLGSSGRHDGSEITTQITTSGPERRRSRRDKKRRSSRDSKKLQRNPERQRTYSFSPGRNDNIRVLSNVERPPVPPLPTNLKGEGAKSISEKPSTYPPGQKPLRASTQPPEDTIQDWQRMPTLHKRSAQELARRKSSKKRKEEHDREAEIKAMVAFMPTRPAAESNSSGRPMKRESRKMRSGLNRNLENPSSDISLPLAESIHSSLSSNSEPQTSYKLSAFDMLAPRPTIRYSENPRYAPPASAERSSSRKRVSERVPIAEETLKANKRIDDLADDLDARELRELMERDQKRRERKKVADKIKIEKKLARRQEKQRADEATAAREGTPPPAVMDRGAMGRDIVGLGIGTSAVVTSSKRKGSTGAESGRGKRPAEAHRKETQDSTTSAHFYRSASLTTENSPGAENEAPVIGTAKVGTVAKAQISPTIPPTRGHVRGTSSISQLMELSRTDLTKNELVPPPRPGSDRKSSEGSVRGPSSWTSFFKRSKNKRGSAPSSFSNTSRDSMQNVSFPPQVAYTPMKSNIPKRTMSKFREDLPELPLSPPDSRVQSPEADVVPPIRKDYPENRMGQRTSSEEAHVRYDTPTSGYRSLEAMRMRDETPTSGNRSIPSPEPAAILSQSLASIDSEGSWLSGRRSSKRGSTQLPPHPLRDSASSLQKRYNQYSESAEELGIAEDEYFSRLTPGPEDQFKINRQSTGNAVPSSDDEDGRSLPSPTSTEPTKWGAVGRQPTVVHREPRAKSREGLLNDFEYDSASEHRTSTPDPKRKSYGRIIDENESGVHRATSVDLGRHHIRHISAGSARLLELKPRASGESKRASQQSVV